MVVGPVGCQSLGYPFAFPSWVTSPKWHLFFVAHICWVTFALWHYFYLELHYNSGLHVSHGITYYLELHGPNGLHMSHGIDCIDLSCCISKMGYTSTLALIYLVLHDKAGLHLLLSISLCLHRRNGLHRLRGISLCLHITSGLHNHFGKHSHVKSSTISSIADFNSSATLFNCAGLFNAIKLRRSRIRPTTLVIK